MPTFLAENLSKYENISYSKETIRKILLGGNVYRGKKLKNIYSQNWFCSKLDEDNWELDYDKKWKSASFIHLVLQGFFLTFLYILF